MDIHQPQVLMEAYLDVYRGQEDDSDAFDQVVDFLVSEGYAEDLEDAIGLIEELEDEEIEGILEGMVNPYASRTPTYNDPWGKSPAMKAHERSEQLQKTELGSKRQRAQTRRSQQLNRLGLAAKQASIREEHDVYDLVLDHLLDEGYASTEQDAIQIMSNMSEEWVDEIIDEATIMSVSRGGKPVYSLSKTMRKLQTAAAREKQGRKDTENSREQRKAAGKFQGRSKVSIARMNADPNLDQNFYPKHDTDFDIGGDEATSGGRVGYMTAVRGDHLANVRRKARARKGRD